MPASPKWENDFVNGSTITLVSATSPTSPPANTCSAPAAAASGRPATQQSTNRRPLAEARPASSFTQAFETVELSIASAPGNGLPASTPLGPVHTSRQALSSVSIVKIARAPSTASCTLPATLAPSCSSALALPGERFHTVTWCPPRSRQRLIGAPMLPMPRNAIFVMSDNRSRECVVVVSAGSVAALRQQTFAVSYGSIPEINKLMARARRAYADA